MDRRRSRCFRDAERYVALLRVVNVGRIGAVAMSDLIANCAGLVALLQLGAGSAAQMLAARAKLTP